MRATTPPILRRAVPLAVALLAAVLSPCASSSQTPRRLNLARYSFPGPAAERTGREMLRDAEVALTRSIDSVGRSPRALAAAFVAFDSVTALALRHWSYLRLRCATDVGDPACDDAVAIGTELGAATEHVQRLVARLRQQGTLARFVRDTALARYRFLISDVLRAAGTVRPPDVSAAIDTLRAPATSWEFPAYLDALGHVAPAPVLTRQSTGAERAAAYRARFTNAAVFGDLFVRALVQTVRGGDAVARAQGDAGAPVRVLESRYLNVDSARALLAAVRARGDLAKRYEREQLAAASLATDDASIGPWDLAAARPPLPVVSLDSAAALMRRALAPLGPVYGEALDRLLDPATERLDVGPGSRRTPGGFSFGAPGFPTGVYLSAFDSTPAGARRLAHESGHALHRQMMIDAGTAPAYLNGAPYLSEAVALFTELVVMDRAARDASDASARARFEEAFLDKALDVFYSAQDAELELGVYDGVEAHRLRTPADLDSLSCAVDAAYTIWTSRVPERSHRWIQVRLMWEDPLYLVNYVYADLIGLKLFAMYERDARTFAPRYVAFLRAGYSDEPSALLRRYFAFGLDPRSLLDDAMPLLDDRLRRYARP